MSRASELGACRVEAESSWGEDSAMSSPYGVPIIQQVDVTGLTHAKMRGNWVQQYLQGGGTPFPGVMGGSFRTRMNLTGHGSSTASTASLTTLARMMGWALGNSAAGAAGTTCSPGSTVSALVVALASGWSAGAIGFCGVAGDGRGGGQPFVISAHATSTMTLLTALPGAPSSGDVIYTAELVYLFELLSTATVQPLRFEIFTGNQQYRCHGCFPQSFQIGGTENGGFPYVEIEWGVSWWEPVSTTFPTATAPDEFAPAPIAGGSVFLAEQGTSTRTTYETRSWSLDVQLGVVPKTGPGGVNASQNIVGATRVPSTVTFEMVVDAETATASPTWPGRWADTTKLYHLLIGANKAASGQRWALYMPEMRLVDSKPTQFAQDRLNMQRVRFEAFTGPTVTTDLTASALRLALG